ncbi:MAG: TonB-dependent receptor [Rhizobiaceae bacterium]|nr:TonB-dependent receptor [Rhizobiaceae bacterium]
MRGRRLTVAAMLVLGLAQPLLAEPVARSGTAAGSVIARKVGEEVRFIEVSNWRGVDVDQQLLAGDVLRTNALGNLAVLFSDNTQIRMGRNTTMVVKSINPGGDSEFELQTGSIWARAERGGEGLVIDTPAAAAAIRGTDWTMTVDGDRTSMIVLEGTVELANPQGKVSVVRGEAASARIGMPPTKTVVVAPDDREQMLFYLSLRNGFGAIPVSPLSSTDIAGERGRIRALPESARNPEDWLTLAEVSLSIDGRAVAEAAADQARRSRLSPRQQARLDLFDATLAGADRRYDEAGRLYARARPHLDARRGAVAAYGAYFVRSLTNPDVVQPLPNVRDGGPYAAIADAWSTGFIKDIPAAIEVVRRAEQRYPTDATLPAVRAQFALLIDDREQVKEAIERSLSLDPDHPTALEARANYRADLEGDLEGALADLERARLLNPGSTTIWNALGLVHGARGAERESEAALRTAIELDPGDPVSYANLAILYLDQNRLAEAKVLIDKSLEQDPEFSLGLVARGSYHMKEGDLDAARRDLLAGTTANPAYAQALLLLAAAYSESGDKEPAEQALENADRLDPNDPAPASVATALAIDGYDADRAIRSAQEGLKRARARGGDFASLSASRDQGSTLNQAYRLQGLDAWGRFYGDAVFDPLSASALVDQAVAGSSTAFVNTLSAGTPVAEPQSNDEAFGSVLQALLLDPQMISSRSRSANLIQRPFVEASVSGGGVAGDVEGWTAGGDIQGYVAYPFPVSFFGEINVRDTEEKRQSTARTGNLPTASFGLSDKTVTGTGYVTAQPTPYDRIVAFANVQNIESRISDGLFFLDPPIPLGFGLDVSAFAYDRKVEDESSSYGGAWSHTFGYRNVVSAGVFLSGFDRDSADLNALRLDTVIGPIDAVQSQTVTSSQDSIMGAVNHTLGIGDLTLRYGAEGGTFRQDRTQSAILLLPFGPPTLTTASESYDLTAGRAYLDAVYEVTPTLKIEAAAFGILYDGDALSETEFAPRLGAAWAPVEGHSLRAGYLREGSTLNAATLAPIGVVGLQADQVPLDVGGSSDTFAARWDAQWTSNVFTSLGYQHQKVDNLAIPVPASLDQISVEEGEIDRLSATLNLWLTHGLGAFATYAHAESRNRMQGLDGAPLPYIPEHTARFGLTWVNQADFKVTLAATYVGSRTADLPGIRTLGSYWTADAFATWEPFDKRIALELAAYNLLDEDFEVAPYVPGWGRSFTGSLKLRF